MRQSVDQKAKDLEILDSIIQGKHPAITYPDEQSGFTRKFPCTDKKAELCKTIGEIALRYVNGQDRKMCKKIKLALFHWDQIVNTQKSGREALEQKRIAMGYRGRFTVILDDDFPFLRQVAINNPTIEIRPCHALMQDFGIYNREVARTVFEMPLETVTDATNTNELASLCRQQRKELPAQALLLNNGFYMSCNTNNEFALETPERKAVLKWSWGQAKVLELNGCSCLAIRNKGGLVSLYDCQGRCLMRPVFDNFFAFDSMLEAVNSDLDIWCYFEFECFASTLPTTSGITPKEALEKLMTPSWSNSQCKADIHAGMIFIEKKEGEINFYEILQVTDRYVEFLEAEKEYDYQDGVWTLSTHGADMEGVTWVHRAYPEKVNGCVQLWGDENTPRCVPWDNRPIESDKKDVPSWVFCRPRFMHLARKSKAQN